MQFVASAMISRENMVDLQCLLLGRHPAKLTPILRPLENLVTGSARNLARGTPTMAPDSFASLFNVGVDFFFAKCGKCSRLFVG